MGKKKLDQADIDLFRQAVGEVVPVRGADKVLTESRPNRGPRVRENRQTQLVRNPEPVTIEQTLAPEDRMDFLAPGAQQRLLRKLRQQGFPLEAELDLHGLTVAQAELALETFLSTSVERGQRCVRIIHGKGYRNPDSDPVLKNQVNIWLRQYSVVLAFTTARPRDGGAGAVWILLRNMKGA